ncbi:MAG: acylphosphatase [Planctomycetota bacterium]|jgi:acylphosphatase
MAVARAHVVFTGYVQGVGFRYTARRTAGGFAVTGWVRNLPDGTVELEAQGERAEVEACLEELRSRMRSNIRSEKLSWIGAADGETEFGIRF